MSLLTLKQYLTEHENDLIAKYGCSRNEARAQSRLIGVIMLSDHLPRGKICRLGYGEPWTTHFNIAFCEPLAH